MKGNTISSHFFVVFRLRTNRGKSQEGRFLVEISKKLCPRKQNGRELPTPGNIQKRGVPLMPPRFYCYPHKLIFRTHMSFT